MIFIDFKVFMVVVFIVGVIESKSYWSFGNLIFFIIIYNEGGVYDVLIGVFMLLIDGIFVFYVIIIVYSLNIIFVDIVKNRFFFVRVFVYGGSFY